MNTLFKTISAFCVVFSVCTAAAAQNEFVAAFPEKSERVWPAPALWTNPLEDWRISGGRLEVVRSGRNRNVHVLTRQLGEKDGTVAMSVVIGRADDGRSPRSAGFGLGIQTDWGDSRSAVFHGRGLDAGIAADGSLFIGTEAGDRSETDIGNVETVELRLTAQPAGNGYRLTLTARDPQSGDVIAKTGRQVAASRLVGNLALVNDFPPRGGNPRPPAGDDGPRHWFQDWTIGGSKVVADDGRAFGPILWSMHTLSRGVMKMTAQMPPLGENDSQTVELQIRENGQWQTIAAESIHPLARTATFRIEDWDDTRDVPYRLAYSLEEADGMLREHHWTGTVRRDPVDKDEIVVAGFTGNQDTGFPNAQIVRNLDIHNPDVLVFTGDQLYERVGGYGIHREPVPLATLNYLRKWYMLGWAFGDLMRDRVTVCIPDDHDVYQGNLWGNGGNPITIEEHDRGGYAMPAEWVNMIERTQTSNLPDPYDPTPIEQGIGVYYTDMLYGRVSFAIIEDRKFKTGPKGRVNYWEGRADHVTDPDFDPASVDDPQYKLLGDRQLKFLRDWAADWRGADLKVVVSQTIFSNVANYHGANQEFLVADLDSNGWPQSGRNRAVHEMRKGFAFHLSGDQHLPSIIHYGIDEHGDAGFSFCVPSIAAGYPRSWRPDDEGRPVENRPDPGLPNTGDYLDGLGHPVRVYAIGNPERENRPGPLNTLHDKASGYGLLRLNGDEQTTTIECWRLLVDVADPQPDDQFPGWPRTVSLFDNYGRRAAAHLPTISVRGMADPVVQVIDESDGEIVYTVRIRGTEFRPRVFKKDGRYTVKVGEQEPENMQTLTNLRPVDDKTIDVAF